MDPCCLNPYCSRVNCTCKLSHVGENIQKGFWGQLFWKEKVFLHVLWPSPGYFCGFLFSFIRFPYGKLFLQPKILLPNSRMSLFELYLLRVFYFILQESNCQTMKAPRKGNQRQTRKGGKQLVWLFHRFSHWFLLFPVSSVLNVKVLVKDDFKKLVVKPCPSSHQLTKNSSWHPF